MTKAKREGYMRHPVNNSVLTYSGKCKGKGHPCTGTEALYRPYGP